MPGQLLGQAAGVVAYLALSWPACGTPWAWHGEQLGDGEVACVVQLYQVAGLPGVELRLAALQLPFAFALAMPHGCAA